VQDIPYTTTGRPRLKAGARDTLVGWTRFQEKNHNSVMSPGVFVLVFLGGLILAGC